MKAYVIKRDDGKYWLGGFYGRNNVGVLSKAHIYQTKSMANSIAKKITDLYNIKMEVVLVEINEYNEERNMD